MKVEPWEVRLMYLATASTRVPIWDIPKISFQSAGSDDTADDDDCDQNVEEDPAEATEIAAGIGNVINGRYLRQPRKHFSNSKLRSLYMYPADVRLREQLTEKIEKSKRRRGGISSVDPNKWPCHGIVHAGNGKEEPFKGTKNEQCRI